ncbi:MAG: DegT/DnrJ/EryC1/StrS family aminotransferase [Polyangiaceae bacterium]|nr:DegT/DnrJ/EryC1/StrS family aminotransferase [Polyangiaceae bacterium]
MSAAGELEPIALFDLARAEAPHRGRLLEAVSEVAQTGRYVLGAPVERFEQELADALGVPHAVGVSSGSDALVCALAAAGVGPGDEVITPAFGFFATVEAVLRLGARPRLVDVAPGVPNLDPGAVDAALGPRTRAIVPVHLYGHAAPLEALARLAARADVALVEDAAQAFGGALGGVALGTWGLAGCFSFFPTKPLGGWGDGGAVVTRSAEVAARVRCLRQHGSSDRRTHREVGGNFRLDAIQAAVLSAKLPLAVAWRAARAAHAARYADHLSAAPDLELPRAPDREEPCWALYTARVGGGRRAALVEALGAGRIETGIYYPTPLHLQPALESLGHRRGEFPEAERAASEVVSLPCHAALRSLDVERVAAAVIGALAS